MRYTLDDKREERKNQSVLNRKGKRHEQRIVTKMLEASKCWGSAGAYQDDRFVTMVRSLVRVLNIQDFFDKKKC